MQHRRNVIHFIEQNGGRITNIGSDPYAYKDFSDPAEERITLIRRLLGDEGVGYIIMPNTAAPEELEWIRDAFPESEVEIEPVVD